MGDIMGFFDLVKRGSTQKNDKKEVHELIEDLREASDRTVRREAQQALVRMGSAAVYPLIGALNDKDWRVREEATRALGEIGDERAVPHIIKMFKDDKIRIQLWATDALITMGDTAVEPLIEALQDSDRRIRMGSIVALGEIREVRAIGPLQDRTKDADREVAEAARDALEAMEEQISTVRNPQDRKRLT
jgi:HEAT repeat protein